MKHNGKNGDWRRDAPLDSPDYREWRDQRRERVRKAMVRTIREAIQSNVQMTDQARDTGLSLNTIRRYRRNEYGPRGPTLLTLFMMRDRE